MDTTTMPVDYTAPRPRDPQSLRRLLSIMRCPDTHGTLVLTEGDQHLAVSGQGKSWAHRGFVPQMFTGLDAKIYPTDHHSNALAANACELIAATDGLVLNLSAGGSDTWYPNVVEAEAAVFRNTDVVADAHDLPFQDEVFSAGIVMNAFEHYHSPHVVSQELFRVLKPGATLLIHTAFLQPVHEAPYHFFNATPFGVRKWFERFEDQQLKTSTNFNPVFALSWIMSDLDRGLRAEGKIAEADLLGAQTFASIMQFWRDASARQGPVWQAFYAASPELQARLAAGIEFVGHKPA